MEEDNRFFYQALVKTPSVTTLTTPFLKDCLIRLGHIFSIHLSFRHLLENTLIEANGILLEESDWNGGKRGEVVKFD